MQSIYLALKYMKPLLVVLYLAVMGFLCASAVQWHFGGNLEILPGATFTGFIFGIYVLNRYTDIREDFANDIGKFFFFSERQYLLYAAIGILATSCLALLWVGRLSWYHIMVLALGIAYSYKIIPVYRTHSGWKRSRIKDIPGIKNLVVALLWGASVFVFPLLYTNQLVLNWELPALFATGLFLSTFNNTLFDDIRDLAGDKIAQIKTLPTLFGEKICISALCAINLLWGGAMAVLTAVGLIPLAAGLLLVILALYPLSYLNLHAIRKEWSQKLEILPELDLFIFGVGIVGLGLMG